MNAAVMKTVPNPQSDSAALGHELVKAKEIINEFVYSCSHSMRGPLKSMSGLINLLQQSIQSGNQDSQVYLGMMTDSVGKMETLLEQFEDFLENSKKDLTHEPVDIRSVIRDILTEAQPVIDQHALRITVNVEQSGYFYTDVHRFRLIFFHLISNAIQFCDREKTARWIDVNVKATSANCNIQVNDNGIGMPFEIHSRIFDLFFRGSEKSEGSGVGLHIVHEVLKKMGGSISVNSQPKEGSNFFVWLPNMTC
jgi:signal transduction histidine kinase